MKLISPSTKFAKSFNQALEEFNKEGLHAFWNMPEPPRDCAEYVQRAKDNSDGKNLPEGWVPATTYWLIDDGRFIGHVNIRHELTDHLKKVGGNIGYQVRPSERRKGYGTAILRLALRKCREMGMKKVLVTCDDENIASAKIIEKNGGVLQDVKHSDVGASGPFNGMVRRYWIVFTPGGADGI